MERLLTKTGGLFILSIIIFGTIGFISIAGGDITDGLWALAGTIAAFWFTREDQEPGNIYDEQAINKAIAEEVESNPGVGEVDNITG